MKIYMPCKRVTSFLLEDVYNVFLCDCQQKQNTHRNKKREEEEKKGSRVRIRRRIYVQGFDRPTMNPSNTIFSATKIRTK